MIPSSSLLLVHFTTIISTCYSIGIALIMSDELMRKRNEEGGMKKEEWIMNEGGVVRVRPCMKASPCVSLPCYIASTSVYVQAQKGWIQDWGDWQKQLLDNFLLLFSYFVLAIHRVSVCISVLSTARVCICRLVFLGWGIACRTLKLLRPIRCTIYSLSVSKRSVGCRTDSGITFVLSNR